MIQELENNMIEVTIFILKTLSNTATRCFSKSIRRFR